MPDENRTIDCADWPTLGTDAVTNARTHLRSDADVDKWQDRGVRGKTLGSTLDFGAWKGCLWQYIQRGSLSSGSGEGIGFYNMDLTEYPAPTGRRLDARRRIMLTQLWTENNSDELPTGVNYEADTFQNSPAWHLWWTGDGSTGGASPSGCFWTPWTSIYVYASDSDGTFWIFNGSGSAINYVLHCWIFESVPAASTVGTPKEKRIWTQNWYQAIKAKRLNRLQDSLVVSKELNQSTLSPVNVWEGAAVYYGQLELLSATGLYLVDDGLDWRNRIMRTHWVDITSGSTYLPTENDYHPNTYNAKDWNIWWTGAGDNPGSPRTGVNWQPVTSLSIAAANAASTPVSMGDLFVDNGSGSDRWAMILNVQHPETS